MAPLIRVIRSRGRGSPLEWAVAAATLQGQTESGDGYLVRRSSHRVLIAVVDGLGHGTPAAEATRAAIGTLKKSMDHSVISLVTHCHEALRKTRGVVMTLASLNVAENAMAWIGIGNVEGVLLRADPAARPAKENIFQRGGVVGYQLPQLQGSVVALGLGDLLIFATDGVDSNFVDSVIKADPADRIAERLCKRHAKSSDDALVFVARYRGRTNGKP